MNYELSQLGLFNAYRNVTGAEYICFSYIIVTFTKTNHIPGHNKNLNKFNWIKIRECEVYSLATMKLKYKSITQKYGKSPDI